MTDKPTPDTAAGDVVEDGFIKRVVPPGPQPEPRCPTDLCSMCFPGEPCIGLTCPVCGPRGGTDGTEPEVGSPAWELRRKVLWDQHARDLMASLIKYEDEHPADAICLAPALEAARRTVPRA